MMSGLPLDQAKHEVGRARLLAELHTMLDAVRGMHTQLTPFEWVRYLAPEGEYQRGVQAILLDKITGSVDRYREFDRYYLPREKHLDERWVNICTAQLQGKELPPIQVYKVGELYFVKDGNHRVSVARRRGQKYIDASIIELNVSVPPEKGDSLHQMIIKGEYAHFLRATGLHTLLPHDDILFTTPGRYAKLLEHIRARQYYLDRRPGRSCPVTWPEAVESWYRRLYSRIVENIRHHEVMHRFPGRTEADLYLWIMDHRYFLSEKEGHDVGSEAATLDFARHHAPRLHRRVATRLQLAWQGQTARLNG